MGGEIKRLSSRNHRVKVEISATKSEARVFLEDNERRQLGKDFVLYIRDNKINAPSAICSVNQFNEKSLMVNILPDLRAPKIKAKFLSKV